MLEDVCHSTLIIEVSRCNFFFKQESTSAYDVNACSTTTFNIETQCFRVEGETMEKYTSSMVIQQISKAKSRIKNTQTNKKNNKLQWSLMRRKKMRICQHSRGQGTCEVLYMTLQQSQLHLLFQSNSNLNQHQRGQIH